LPDQVTGTGLAVLGIAAAIGGSRLPAVPGQDVGPAAFPMVIGGLMAACGAAIALGVGRSFEAPEPDDAAPPRFAGARALLPPALLLGYALLVDPLGFLVTAAMIVALAAWAFGAGWRLILPLAIAAPIGVHLVFAKLLRVPLPEGLLAAPW
jgi:putative tricarboxylic transport membrane protein